MAKEAYFIIDCSLYSSSIVEIISAFNTIGWGSSNNQIEYLPLHDNDNFDWQTDSISVEDFLLIISNKQKCNELCGVILYHQYSDRGIMVLARNTKEIMVNININRKTISGDFTDISWYIENIAAKLENMGCTIESLNYSETIG